MQVARLVERQFIPSPSTGHSRSRQPYPDLFPRSVRSV